MNESTEKSPFEVVYTKVTHYPANLFQLPPTSNKSTEALADHITITLEEVKMQLAHSNAKYKVATDLHQHLQTFEEGELVIIYLQKSKFPTGEYSMLQAKMFSPFHILCKNFK